MFIIILILIFLTFLFVFYFNKTFGKVLPITLMIIPLILFLSEFIFHTFQIGIYSIIFLAMIGIKTTIEKVVKKDKMAIRNAFSKGFFSFILIFIFFLILDAQREFTLWDELAHWGMMVKEMLRLDSFYSISNSLLVWHKDYPPFISLFEYFWCCLLGYKEEIVFLSFHIFEIGLIVPYFVDTLKKKSTILLLPILLISTILMFDSYQIFLSIQVDFLISIEVLFGLIFLFVEKENTLYKNITLTLILTALLLTKQIGLPLAFMLLAFYFINSIWIEKNLKDKHFLIFSVTFVIIPFIFFGIWNLYTTIINTGAQFNISNVNLKEYFEIIFFHKGKDYKLSAISLFYKYLFTEPVLVKPFTLGYIPCSILFFLFLLLFFAFNKKELGWKKFLTLILIFLCGSIGYAFLMSVLYLFCFSVEETITLACFGRYMSSYIIIEFLFLMYLQLYYWSNKPNFCCKTILLSIICILSVLGSYKNFLISKQQAHYTDFKRIANEVMVTEKNSKLFVIMKDNSFEYLLPYYLDSRILDSTFHDFYHLITTYDKERVLNVLFNQDYLYIDEIPENFIKEYNAYFDPSILPRTLYKINQEERKIRIYE